MTVNVRNNLSRPLIRLTCVALAAGVSFAATFQAAAQDGTPERGGTVIAALNATTIPTLNTQLTSNIPPLFAADGAVPNAFLPGYAIPVASHANG